MSFRILVIISLFFVLAGAVPPRRREQGCYCVPLFTSKTFLGKAMIESRDGTPLFNASDVTGDGGGGGRATCEDALSSCEKRCKLGLRDEHGLQIPSHKLSPELGKKLCDALGVEVLSTEERSIFIEARVGGCDAYRKIDLGKICCTECSGPVTRKNGNGIYFMYIQDCKNDLSYLTTKCPPELHAGPLIVA